MGAYERIGVRSIINATCHWTVYGGTVMWPEVIEAMADARRSCVDMRELHDRASEIVSRYTHAQASYITSGCAAALEVGAAAILTGEDRAKMSALPRTTGLMKNEFIARRFPRHRDEKGQEYVDWNFGQSILGAGGMLIEVGDGRGVTREELEAAFGPNTVGVYWVAYGLQLGVKLDEVIQIAHQRGVPVLLDAANTLPPPEHLHRFVEMGADLVAFSGGKGLRGPQGSGILTGRADLIRAARMQSSPYEGIGRPMKVSKEEVIGLITALEVFANRDHEADLGDAKRRTDYVVEALKGLPGIRAEHRFPDHEGRMYPTVFVHIDPATGLTAAQVIKELLGGTPPIAVMGFSDPQIVRVDVRILPDDEVEQVARRLYEVLAARVGTR